MEAFQLDVCQVARVKTFNTAMFSHASRNKSELGRLQTALVSKKLRRIPAGI
jgi:hypothetical protein